MSVLKLINEFAKRETVPVEIDDIVDFIRGLGIADEIYFWDADFNTNVVQAALHHWEYTREGWTVRVADIYTAQSLTPAEKRVAQAKELLHILDLRFDRVNTPEDVDALIDKIVIPPAYSDPVADGDHVLSDRIAILHVIAALLPMATRELLLPHLHENKITLDEIADLVAVPKPYVVVAMNDTWLSTYRSIISLLERYERVPDRVFTLDANQAMIEVHSVPLETDPYSYAKRLEEKNRDMIRPIEAFVIETRRGRRTISSAELAAYVPLNGRKPN
jgi:hypothetical protein